MEKHHSKNYTIEVNSESSEYVGLSERIKDILEDCIELVGSLDSPYLSIMLKLEFQKFWRGDGARFPWDCQITWNKFMNVTTGLEVTVTIKNFMELRHNFIKLIVTKKL